MGPEKLFKWEHMLCMHDNQLWAMELHGLKHGVKNDL